MYVTDQSAVSDLKRKALWNSTLTDVLTFGIMLSHDRS